MALHHVRRRALVALIGMIGTFVIAAAAPAAAAPPSLVIRGYGVGQSGQWALAEGAYFAALRTALNDPVRFGPSGVVKRDVDLRGGVNKITPAALLGVDVFVATFRGASAVAADEIAALSDFVEGGGALLAMTDRHDTSATAAVGVTAGCPGGNTGSGTHHTNNVISAQAAHPVLKGPFGTVTSFRTHFNYSCFPTASLPSHATPLAVDINLADQAPSLLAIAPGALATGSGPVVVVSDSDFAASAAGAPDLRLPLNMLTWLAGDGADEGVTQDGVLTSTGQALDVDIATPVDGAVSEVDDQALTVTGTASLSDLGDQPINVSYVVDVSGSTSAVRNMDCNGDHAVNALDNINGDANVGDILDCEISSVRALHGQIDDLTGARVGVVGLGGSSTFDLDAEFGADMQPAPASGRQRTVPANELDSPGKTRAVRVVEALRAGVIGQYTPTTVGESTHYDTAIHSMLNQMASSPAGRRVAFFLSDGLPTSGSFDATPAGILADAARVGVQIHTYAVGTNSGGCLTGRPLQVIAARTGGTCTNVVNPAALTTALATSATLSGVEVRLGAGAPVTVPVAPDGTWTATLPAPGLRPGVQTVSATAVASDGTRVADQVSVRGTTRPVVSAGTDVAVPEGSTVALAGTATDADGQALTLAWAPAANLSNPAVLAPTYSTVDDATETLTLTATDPDGLADSDDVLVTTQNVAPQLTGVAISAPVVTGQTATLTGSFSDPGTVDTHTLTVDWGDGTSSSTAQAVGGFSREHAYASGGSYTVTVTARDDDGGESTSLVDVSVNTTPEADAGGPYSVPEGSSITLDATTSDADGDVLTHAWSPAAGLDDASLQDPTFSAVDGPATVPLSLLVDDGRGLSASDTAELTVLNVAPDVSALTLPTTVVAPGTTVPLSATVTDPGVDDAVTVSVDWGDGTVEPVALVGDQLSASHAYSSGGLFTVVVTALDKDGATGTATGTVTTNRPPVVDAGASLTLVEGDIAALAATASDPDGDALTYSWTPASGLSDTSALSPTVTAVDDGVLTYTLTATDPFGATATDTVQVTVLNSPPVLGTLTAPAGPVALGTSVGVSGAFTDAGAEDTHTTSIDWGDGSTTAGTVSGLTAAGSHTYAAAGVYEVTMTVTDDDGGSSASTHQYAVVYDPSAGFVTGGGTFASRAGAYAADPSLSGPASFGFTARYQKGKTVPTGQTQFQFKAGDLRFHSTAYEWLVVSGSKAQYRGSGELNGVPGYRFQLSAVDGDRQGDGVDRLRIKVIDAAGVVVYDNQRGDDDAAAATTAITGGSITIHA